MHYLSRFLCTKVGQPQDLFGFYNYIESRYKATELSRAMVQMERFNRQPF